MEIEKLLEQLGLSKNETKTYLKLLSLGSVSAGPLIKQLGMHRAAVYNLLDILIDKGLVHFVVKANRKYFEAQDPERLLEIISEQKKKLEQQEYQLKEAISQLKAKYEEKKYTPTTEVYEGIKGFKTFYEWTLKELKKGDCIDILGVPKIANEKFGAYFIYWNKRRIKLGIKMRIIYNNDCRDVGKLREKMKLTEVRYMDPKLETPAWIDIFNDYVVTIDIHGNPICFVIKNKYSAESYKQHFNLLWKQAKK